MNGTRAIALQLCPFSAYLEAGIQARFEVVRWFELTEVQRAELLENKAQRITAIATGGHIGCPSPLLAALPALRVIAINGVGVDKVDLPLAQARGVRVGTTPGVLTEDVADLAIGLVIGLLRGIPASDAYVRAGHWPQGERPLARKVSGRRFGIVGLGHIGSAIATRLAAFGSVAYTGPHRKDSPYAFHDTVLSLATACDVLVLACPANASTRHLVGPAVLQALGPQGYLVNVARGAIVDEAALIAALAAGQLAGAALDVFENEPVVPQALRDSNRVVLTPHVASATVETRTRMADMVLESLEAGLAPASLPA